MALTRGTCDMCIHFISVTMTNLGRQHGPVTLHCAELHKLPWPSLPRGRLELTFCQLTHLTS